MVYLLRIKIYIILYIFSYFRYTYIYTITNLIVFSMKLMWTLAADHLVSSGGIWFLHQNYLFLLRSRTKQSNHFIFSILLFFSHWNQNYLMFLKKKHWLFNGYLTIPTGTFAAFKRGGVNLGAALIKKCRVQNIPKVPRDRN